MATSSPSALFHDNDRRLRPYTGHNAAFATLTDPKAGIEVEVKTYADGPLIIVRDTEGAVRTMTAALPWAVIHDLAQHHAAAEALLRAKSTTARGKKGS
jgi:hypothetical protein